MFTKKFYKKLVKSLMELKYILRKELKYFVAKEVSRNTSRRGNLFVYQ